MKERYSGFHRIIAYVLCFVLVMGMVPAISTPAMAETAQPAAATGIVTDPGTAYTWETMMGTDTDGNRYAGRVWVDKSVYKNGDTAILNTRGESTSSFEVELEDDKTFQVIFSALGATMTTKSTITGSGPMDVVLVLDTSTSMDDESDGRVTRLQLTIEAANKLLAELSRIRNVRIAVVTYNKDSETVLPLANYTNGVKLVVTNYKNDDKPDAGVVKAYDNDNKLLGQDDGYTSGTNLQSGIDRGFNILANEKDVQGRVPVAIVLTDGQANRASEEGFYELSSHDDKDGTSASDARLYLSTLLNAAYTKTKIEENYGKDATVYTIGVDLEKDAEAHVLMNPGDSANGFNSGNREKSIRDAYNSFQNWVGGRNVTVNKWVFDHKYPTMDGKITRDKIVSNIYYADKYYDISAADLDFTFNEISEELSSGAFNPISSSSSQAGATGVDDTPLIYVDFIGQHMQIKEMQAITLFGSSYGIINNGDGTYTVTEATGTNPTTNEAWNTAEDILISVTEQADGTQKLEIRVNQQILPIIMEQVVSETVGNTTTATITEHMQAPLRVFYTVGLSSDVLLPNGELDVSKLQGYQFIDDAAGTADFYSNRFGVENPANTTGTVIKGDAHVGFQPSAENRYYYHQSNQGIFTGITNKSNGATVTIPENNEYGIIWDEDAYELDWMTYEDYQKTEDSDKVYTYVTYYRPTPRAGDAANAAEEVTYLVYTDWGYLKESVAFFDNNTGTYLNDGKAIAPDQVESVIRSYMRTNPRAELYAVLGVGSMRTSRLHNMTVEKTQNNTQTAVERYTPEYTYETAGEHNDNDVVVWLGNNGKLTVQIDTGIALTKQVTEAIGNADDTYALTVTVPAGVAADPVVTDSEGKDVTAQIATYANNVLTVNVKAGQTVYVSGIPGGTECQIDEIVDGDYYKVENESATSVTVPTLSQVLDETNPVAQYVPAVVTNAPHKFGSLYITKMITSDHAVPESVLNTEFEITVYVGTELAGKSFTVLDSGSGSSTVTVDENGNMTFAIKARQTIEILQLPAGTAVTVTETTPDAHFAVSYRTLNHSGETADSDNAVVIPTEGNATAVVMNHYTPGSTSVDLDIAGTKVFTIEGAHDSNAFEFKVQQWNGTAWVDINGKTAEVSYEANEAGTKTFTIEDVLAGITYTEVGTYAYQVLEVKGDASNVTYDRTLYTFNVTVTDNGGQLVAVVTDKDNAPITDGSYEVTFNNTYHTAPVSIDIIKEVENKSGDETVSKAGFAFTAVETDSEWNALTGEAASALTVFSDAAGKARVAAIYTEAGTSYYLLSEQQQAARGWTYSEAQYRITVTVTEDNGELTAELAIEKVGSENADEIAAVDAADATKGTVSFVNTYDPEDVTIDLDGAVTKELTGKTLEAEQFTFYVYADGDRTKPILTGTNDLDGDVSFVDFDEVLTFEAVGTYQYDVVEMIPNGAVLDAATGKYVLDGMYYDPTVYDLVVEVTNDPSTGSLVASSFFEDAVSDVVTFHNSYKAVSTSYVLGGVKLLHGRAPKAGEFTFELYEGETLVDTAYNRADGRFTFKTISYTQAGTYTYTIKEKAGNVAGVRYDGVQNPVTVTVTVTDTNGVLHAAANVTNSNVRFENTYQAEPTQMTLVGTKALEGAQLTNGKFTFQVYEGTRLVSTGTNDADGVITFDPITYTMTDTGTHTYTVVEVNAHAPGYTYDKTVYTVVVEVQDNGDGTLSATKKQNPELHFENTYTVIPINVTLLGTKNMDGRELQQGEFYFELCDTMGRVLQAVPNGEGGGFGFIIRDLTVGTYNYIIREQIPAEGLPGVTYDHTEYDIEINVTDNGDGTLSHTVSVEGNEMILFTNSYSPEITEKVTLTGTKTLTGRNEAMKPGEFAFNIYDSTGAKVGSAANDAQGNIAVDLGTFSDVGTYTFTVKEDIPAEKNGITYDTAAYLITVTVTDDTANGKLVAETVITKDGQTVDSLDFENSYKVDPIDVKLEGTKSLTGRDMTAGEFTFKLTDASGKEVTTTNAANGSFSFTLEDLTAGTYVYTVEEVKGAAGGVSYDSTKITATVTVTDDNMGNLTAETVYTVGGNTVQLGFENAYTVTGEANLTLTGTKNLEGRDLVNGEFSFKITENGTTVSTGKNDASGKITFSTITYKAADIGQHFYVVSEDNDGKGGVEYDDTVYTVIVTVSDNGKGGITVSYTVDSSADKPIVFNNGYSFEGSEKLTIAGGKILNGDRKLSAGDFTFILKKNGQQVQTVTNNADGSFAFNELTFTQEDVGTYTYTVTEVNAGKGGHTYDSTVYTYTVTVADNGIGGISVTKTLTAGGQAAEGIVFTNGYTITGNGQTQITGKKTLTGDKKLTAGEFSFQLKDSNGTVLETVTNGADGTFKFKTLTYTKADIGTHTYTVSEVNAGKAGYTYDDKVYTVTVTVADNGTGGLTVTQTGGATIAFTNSYTITGSGEVILKGTKKLTGKTLNAGDYTFQLKDSSGAVIDTATNAADRSFTFKTLTYTKADIGTHTYTVTEVNDGKGGITYDDTVYTVTVTVADNGTGGLTVTQSGGEDIVFNNTYSVTGTTKITFTGTKELGGKTMQNGEFKFVIMEGDTKVAEGTNDANGIITFSEMVFGAADIGQHTYTIYEVAGSVEGMTYDDTVYTVVISVVDDGNGSVDVELVSASGEEIVFVNIFVPKTLEVKVPVTKTVENNGTGAMGPGGFKFVLKDAEGNVIAQAESNTEGLAELLLAYDLDGVGIHTYTLSEVNTGITGVTYDVSTYTVTVVVEQEADGQLKAQVTVTDAAGQSVEQIAFVNSYTPPVTPPTGDVSEPHVYVAAFYISGLGLVLMLAVLVIDFKKKPLFKK